MGDAPVFTRMSFFNINSDASERTNAWQSGCTLGFHKENLMGLRDKYAYAIQTAKGLRMEGAADERDGKLYFHGSVGSEEDVNAIWNAIKTIPDWRTEIVADIKATGRSGGAKAEQTYTVKSGDTLSKIAKALLGDGNAYMDIFNANRDQLSDPNAIKPGQTLKIPAPAHH